MHFKFIAFIISYLIITMRVLYFPPRLEPLEGMGQIFSKSEYKGQRKFSVNVWGVRSVARHLSHPQELNDIWQVWRADSLCRDTARHRSCPWWALVGRWQESEEGSPGGVQKRERAWGLTGGGSVTKEEDSSNGVRGRGRWRTFRPPSL